MDLIQAVVALVMFTVMGIIGLELTVNDFRQVLRFPVSVALGVLGQLIFLPVVACILIVVLNLDEPTTAALLIVAACPGGGLTNILTAKARGNIALSISLTALYGLISLLSIPVILLLGFAWFLQENSTIQVPAGVIVGQLIILVIVPVGLGMTLRAKRENFVLNNTKLFAWITNFSLVVLVAFSIILDNGMRWAYVEASLLPAGIFSIATLAIGFTLGKLGRLNRADHIALSIEFIIRNNAISTLIVMAILQKPELMGFVAASILFQLPLGLLSAAAYRLSERKGLSAASLSDKA